MPKGVKKKVEMSWEECEKIINQASDHYAMYNGDVKAIYDLAVTLPKGAVMLEIGVCNGRTSMMLAYVAKKLNMRAYGIDNFVLENTYEGVMKLMDDNQLPYILLKEDSKTIAWDKPIDLLIIDGDHSYKGVHSDAERFLPHLKSGGYVIFDDFDKERTVSAHEGIWKTCDEFCSKWKNWEAGRAYYAQKP